MILERVERVHCTHICDESSAETSGFPKKGCLSLRRSSLMLYSAGVHIPRRVLTLSSNLLQTLFSNLAEDPGWTRLQLYVNSRCCFSRYLQPDELQRTRTEMVQEVTNSKVKGPCLAKFSF